MAGDDLHRIFTPSAGCVISLSVALSFNPESSFTGFISEWRFDFGIFSRNGTSLVSGNMQNITYKLKIRHIKI